MTQSTEADMRRRNIETIYPLAPLQEGILFHTLMAPDESGVYLPQMAYHLTGPIDASRLRAAWEAVLERHAALRTAIHWEERNEPFQLVYRKLPLSWEEQDWRGLDAEAALQALFRANRDRPFDLRRPPLFRLHLARVATDRHVLVLCHHHIILDGWSTARLLQDVMTLYRGGALPPARPYVDYVRWLRRQDGAAAMAFWQEYVAGTPGPSLAFGGAGEAPDFVRGEWVFPEDLARRVTTFCAKRGVTLSTLLQGTLGLVVAERLKRRDVFFGNATSGRPATLPGATEMVGLFINALPVRAQVDPEARAGDWLEELQRRQAATIEHEHVALRDIQAGLGTLFDSLLVVENYPVTVGDGPGDIGLANVEFDEWTHFPLTLLVAPGHAGMKLILRHDHSVLPDAELAAFLARYTELLEALATSPDARLIELVGPLRDLPPAEPATPVADATRAAETETEQRVAAIWAEVLKRGVPAATDNFFAIGGHSLLAAKIVTRLRREFDVEIPVRAMFDRPVLADFATYLDARRVAGPAGREDAVVEF